MISKQFSIVLGGEFHPLVYRAPHGPYYAFTPQHFLKNKITPRMENGPGLLNLSTDSKPPLPMRRVIFF